MNASIEFRPGVKPPDRSRPRLCAEEYYTPEARAVPVINYSDYSNADFPIYGNDKIGDCTFAGLAHLFGAWTKYAQPAVVIFDDRTIVKGYSAVSGYVPLTGANDNGCTLQEVLDYGRTHGLIDPSGLKRHQVDAYAEIRDLSVAGLSRALSVFGGVYVAVDLPQSAEDQFNTGEPWTFTAGSPILGGHCITLQQIRHGMDMLGFVTWGALQRASRTWVHNYVTEAWAVYSADFVNATTGQSPSGLNATQLMADVQSV